MRILLNEMSGYFGYLDHSQGIYKGSPEMEALFLF